MIPYTQLDILFSIGPFNVKVWGFLAVLGFLAGLFIAVKESKRKKLDINKIFAISLYILIFGLIGARLGYMLTVKSLSFMDIFNIWQGGLIWHGAFLGGLFGVYLAIARDKFKLKYLDILGVAIPFGHAIGRIGCYLAGIHLGKLSALPWSIFLEGQLRHPISGYEAIAEFALFAIIFSIRKKKFFDGAIFCFYVIGYSMLRFILDFLRTDPTYIGLTVAQWLSIILFLIFGRLVLSKINKRKK